MDLHSAPDLNIFTVWLEGEMPLNSLRAIGIYFKIFSCIPSAVPWIFYIPAKTDQLEPLTTTTIPPHGHTHLC